MKENSTI